MLPARGMCGRVSPHGSNGPGDGYGKREALSRRDKWNSAFQLRLCYLVIDVRIAPVITAANMLDELHVSPGCSAELPRIIVAGPCPDPIAGGQLVPLLAGNLACFAANTQAGIGEKAPSRLGPEWRTFLP